MTAEEHPEELLDRALAGELGTAERAVLDAHLAACSACAVHLELGARLRSGTVATAARDEGLNRVAIAAAMAWSQAPQRWPAPRARWMSLRLAAASILLVAGLAAAAVSLRTAPAPPATAVPARGGSRSAKATPSGPTVTASTAATSATDSVVDPLAPEARALAPSPSPGQTRRSERSATAGPSATALFARASDLRRQGHADHALDTYRVLQRRYPGTREANLSFALAGRLRLEHARPAQALVEFDHYLKIDAEVAEEALAGRAEALYRLDRRPEEAAAWRLLLARFPGSIYAERARSRLAAQDVESPSSPTGRALERR